MRSDSAQRRLSLSLLLSLLLSFVVATSHVVATATDAESAGTIDEQFQITAPDGPGYTGYLVNNTRSLVRFYSFLATFRVDNGRIAGMKPCKSLAECPSNFSSQVADLNLTVCKSAAQSNCVVGVSTENTLTKETSTLAIDKSELTSGFNAKVKGDASKGLPDGGNPLVVSIPSAPHAGGDLYLVKSDYYAARKSSTERFSLALLTNGIYPVTIERGEFKPGGPNLEPRKYVGQPAGNPNAAPTPPFLNGFTTDPRCLMATREICLVPQAFPENITFGLKLRLNQGFNGWLYGRLAEPLVAVIPSSNNSSVELTLKAKPVQVPVPYGWVMNSQLPPAMLAQYEKDRGGGIYVGKDPGSPLESISILKGHSNKYDDSGIQEMLNWMPLLGDKAAALPTQWSFQTLNLKSDTAQALARCTSQTKTLAGLIFTNATTYSSGAPTFDADSGSLDYKVAAPHFAPDGETLITGTYDLVLNSQVARCIYGFTSAPVSASISIVNESGEDRVATTTISESDGFLRMAAYGFTFSSPKIRIKLTQAGISPAPTAKKSVTITCAKGATTKKVSGLSPKCPSGFKRR